jgi:hypothetical protein
VPVLIYLHGFKSSPDALKAQEVAQYIADKNLSIDYLRPLISDMPDKAIQQLDNLMQSLQNRTVYLMGSSMGGYYATWLAEKYSVSAVLINPAIHPDKLWQEYIGLHQNPYSGVQFEISAAHLQDLQSIKLPCILHPQQYLVLLQMGDEVLNALDASQWFYRSSCIIESGGNHRFQDFHRYLPHIMQWLKLE